MPLSDAALRDLASRHREFIGFLAKRVGDRDEAEDLLQAAFLRAVERREQVRNDESAVAWFYRLLRNAMVDRARRSGVERRGTERAAIELGQDEAVDQSLHEAACRCVLAVLPGLKPDYADLLRRIDVGGAEIGDTAAALGLTPATTRVRLHRARRALRREVERTCRTCARHACVDCHCRDTGV